jgi:effector-binding domain-containing protein
MEKEFIPYKQALELKELGFNGPCFGYYYNGDYLLTANSTLCQKKSNTLNAILAPLYQQAFRWFREKHMLSGAIIPTTIHYGEDTMEYTYDIRGKYTTCVHIGTYEEAELACLKKLIEIIKEK